MTHFIQCVLFNVDEMLQEPNSCYINQPLVKLVSLYVFYLKSKYLSTTLGEDFLYYFSLWGWRSRWEGSCLFHFSLFYLEGPSDLKPARQGQV